MTVMMVLYGWTLILHTLLLHVPISTAAYNPYFNHDSNSRFHRTKRQESLHTALSSSSSSRRNTRLVSFQQQQQQHGSNTLSSSSSLLVKRTRQRQTSVALWQSSSSSSSSNSAEKENTPRPYRLGLGGFRLETTKQESSFESKRNHGDMHKNKNNFSNTMNTTNSSRTPTLMENSNDKDNHTVSLFETNHNSTVNNHNSSRMEHNQKSQRTNNTTNHHNKTQTTTSLSSSLSASSSLPSFTALLTKQQPSLGGTNDTVKKIIDDLMDAVTNVTSSSSSSSVSSSSSSQQHNNSNTKTTKKKPYEFKSPFLSMTQFNASAFRSMSSSNTNNEQASSSSTLSSTTTTSSSRSSPLSLLKYIEDDNDMDKNNNNNNDDGKDNPKEESIQNSSTWSSSSSSSKKHSKSNISPKKTKIMKRPTTTRTTTSVSPPIATLGRRKEDIVTVADLEKILLENGFVRKADLSSTTRIGDGSNDSISSTPTLLSKGSRKVGVGVGGATSTTTMSTTTKTSDGIGSTTSKDKSNKQVAFPQSSVLSYQDVTMGSTVSGGMLGIILGLSLYPNLWLIGMVLGCAYGYDSGIKEEQKSKDAASAAASDASSGGGLRDLIVALGRRLAKAYLKLYDGCRGIWFMYKTGQLSYEYYKRYEALDDKFAIQDKMDAWNERFQEGKIKFDQWEKENEIGRKVLATLRTAWLVQEESAATTKNKKKQQQRRRFKFLSIQQGKSSKYRIVQYFYNMVSWCQQSWSTAWAYVNGGMNGRDILEFWKGLKSNIMENSSEQLGSRIGAALAALVGMYCIGAMFAVAPNILGLVAVILGILFPTWLPEFLERFVQVLSEVKQRGRSLTSTDENNSDVFSGVTQNSISRTTSNKEQKTREESWFYSMFPLSSSTSSSKKKKRIADSKVDMSRYYFYQRNDGSKHWYRTGNSWFRNGKKSKKQKKRFLGFGREPEERKMNSWGFWT